MRKTCLVCGNLFETSYPNQKYCSSNCYRQATKKYMKKYMIDYWKNNPSQYEKMKERMRKFPQNTKKGRPPKDPKCIIKDKPLFNELPDERRNLIMEIAKRQQSRINIRNMKIGNKCEVCGKEREENIVTLLLHHVRYYPEETITLCGSCHMYLHKYIEKKRKTL